MKEEGRKSPESILLRPGLRRTGRPEAREMVCLSLRGLFPSSRTMGGIFMKFGRAPAIKWMTKFFKIFPSWAFEVML